MAVDGDKSEAFIEQVKLNKYSFSTRNVVSSSTRDEKRNVNKHK